MPNKDYYDIITSEAFKKWFGNWEKAYDEAGLNFSHPAWKGVSKAVNDSGKPLVLYHGTTHEWTKYSRKLGNHENDMGIGFYATSEKYDAAQNYLSEGQDITTRIAVYAEHYSEVKNVSQERAMKIAEKKFKGDSENIIEVFLNIKRPLIIKANAKIGQGTFFDFEDSYNDSTEEYTESKTLVKFKEAFDETAEDFNLGYDDKNRIWGDFAENLGEIYSYLSASKVIEALKRSDWLYEITYDEEQGGNRAYEFVAQVFQKYGFDGVIYLDAQEQFGGMNIPKGTKHFVAYKANQIKLADGTNTTFDKKNNDIRLGGGGEVDGLIKVKPNRFLYHKSNPIFRDKIKNKGLVTKGKSETWLEDTEISGKVIFATNSNDRKDWFDTTYDDDIYEIDTDLIKNTWYKDPNFVWDKKSKHVITFENIPSKAIKLIYSGKGGDTIQYSKSEAKDVISSVNPDLKFDKGGLIAPNGKKSNLTSSQYKLVRTPEFKSWFGDWENSPETSSKVVDENGEPLVVWHGTYKEFYVFGEGQRFKNVEHIRNTNYFHKSRKYAEKFGFEKPYFLNIKNIDLIEQPIMEKLGYFKDVYDQYVLKGIDGVYTEDGEYATLINSNQIKLADGTNTTFDGKNPDIRFNLGGEIEEYKKQGIVDLNFYPTSSEHAKEYGIDAVNPLYVQNIIVDKDSRLKSIGSKIIQYLDEYAKQNGHDVIFGHISEKATMTKDNRTGYFTEFTDVDWIKHWLHRKGYVVKRENNYFYKKIDVNN